tara:strand:- start:37 stop:183 length:147 start_codon:yes stop_codon:yes gene_type:complete
MHGEQCAADAIEALNMKKPKLAKRKCEASPKVCEGEEAEGSPQLSLFG